MRRFLVSSLLLHICALVDPSRKSTGWFVVVVMEVAMEVGAVIAMPMEVVLTEMVSVRVLPVIVVPVTVMPMIKVGQGCRCHE